MNKNDIKLIVIILFVAFSIIIFLKLNKNNNQKEALVYYQNNLVLTIDLSDFKYEEYNVDGYNGNVLIIKEDGKIKVSKENSPLHLCSKQGWIKENYETIVCLPNKIVIKIDAVDKLDAVVK